MGHFLSLTVMFLIPLFEIAATLIFIVKLQLITHQYYWQYTFSY